MRLHCFLTTAAVILVTPVSAQPGTNDFTFDPGSGLSGSQPRVLSTSLTPEGKIIIGGSFTSYNSTTSNNIACLNIDGDLDTAFNPGNGVGQEFNLLIVSVNSTAIQFDEKIIIGGNFTRYNDNVRNSIARINPNGSLDSSFNPGTGTGVLGGNPINSISLQLDEKIVIGGNFTNYNGTTCNRIARLNTDGSIDNSFNPISGANNYIKSIAIQPDGKIIIGGSFTSYDGIMRNHISRLNSDGSLDNEFDPGTGASGSTPSINSIAIQPDGKIIIAGQFTTYNGIDRNCIARLNADGSLDNDFNPGSGATAGVIYSAALQPDGKIIIGGSFTGYDGIIRIRIARLNADGGIDSSFNPGAGATGDFTFNRAVHTTTIQPDGRIILGGNFTNYDNASRNGIARATGGITTVAVENIGETNLEAYPNPTIGTFTISLDKPNQDLTIFDATGRVVQQRSIFNHTGPITLDLSDQPSGHYLVQVRFSDGTQVRESVVKE